jgi:hypothetical protein
MVAIPSSCLAGISAISPSALANIEAAEINALRMQNGCLRPDLADSSVDGTAVIEISFTPEGKPIDATIVNSNGSDSDNAKIIEAFTKRCKYTYGRVNIPVGATKEFTYKWKAHQTLSGLSSCILKVEYPLDSVRNHEEGKATVAYRYRPDGSYESKISQSTNSPRLDERTLKSVNTCLDNQALKGDTDLNKWNEVSMNWKITDREGSKSSLQQSSSTPNSPQN